MRTDGTSTPKVSLEDQLLEPGMPLSRGKRVVLGIPLYTSLGKWY